MNSTIDHYIVNLVLGPNFYIPKESRNNKFAYTCSNLFECLGSFHLVDYTISTFGIVLVPEDI